MFFLNFSGLHVLLCYSSTVFSMSGNPAVDPRISTIVLGAAVLLSCLASIVVVSRLRNHLRYLIVWSVFGMAMAQMALAMCFLYNERREEALNTEVVHDGFGNSTIYDQIEEDDPLPVHVRWLPLFAVLGFMLVGR
jgi:heme/copper-type cytochrome/quinol oxidase subunit 4